MAVRQKGVPVRAGADTQVKSAVRESLIRWKTVRFSIEGRVIAHSVFASDHSDSAKLGKSLITQNSTRKILVSEFRPFLSFRIVTYIDGRKESVLSPNVKKYMKIRGGTVSILLDDVLWLPDAVHNVQSDGDSGLCRRG